MTARAVNVAEEGYEQGDRGVDQYPRSQPCPREGRSIALLESGGAQREEQDQVRDIDRIGFRVEHFPKNQQRAAIWIPRGFEMRLDEIRSEV